MQVVSHWATLYFTTVVGQRSCTRETFYAKTKVSAFVVVKEEEEEEDVVCRMSMHFVYVDSIR